MVGHRFVEALRDRDRDGRWHVTVLCEEPTPAYDRVALSSYVDSWDRGALAMAGNDYAGDDLVHLRVGERVTAIDRDARTVTTSTGARIGYDALVLATGSYPFVPPVPGKDPTAASSTARSTISTRSARRPRPPSRGPTGIVVGGGLLGLEAANALRLLGMTPHVVELAPRLMPLQVDEGGGAVLADIVTRLGVTVHTGVSTTAIDDDGSGLRATLSDGEIVDGAVLVFSAGVRPRDELARACGLEIGERGGVVTDIGCRTSDPHIYAVGEVAAIEGRCYGLVAPGYATAEVVADRLLGGTAEFPGADMSTKLKLLGVDVASFGDAHAATDGALEVVLNDPTKGTYAKLVVSDDASTLLGGILVGDATAYGTLRPLVGRPLPADPAALIAPAGAEVGVGALPDDAQICSCNAVSKGAICAAISQGACDVPAIKAATVAGTSCGSCVPMLKRLLEAQGVEQSKALCEHFTPVARRAVPDRGRHRDPHVLGADRRVRHRHRLRHLQAGRRLDPGVDVGRGTSSTASPPRCRTPTTTSWPTCNATAPTRWCRGCPAARSLPRSSSRSARSPAISACTPRSPAASASTCSARGSSSCR